MWKPHKLIQQNLKGKCVFLGFPGDEQTKETCKASRKTVEIGSFQKQEETTKEAIFSHLSNCTRLMEHSGTAYHSINPPESPFTRILLLISMSYKTFFITEEEKGILKSLAISNDPRLFAALEHFESVHTLYAIQERFQIILNEEINTYTNENPNQVPQSIPEQKMEIRSRHLLQPACSWHQDGSILYRYNKIELESKLIIFSLEGTLVQTKSGELIPLNALDWIWIFPSIPFQLIKLHNDGYNILIITNQAHIHNKSTTEAISFMVRIEKIIESLYHIPITVIASISSDEYQKPQTGLFSLFLHLTGTQTSHWDHIISIGDLAGRKKDKSSQDREFALNLKIPFKTPNHFFREERPQNYSIPFFPKDITKDLIGFQNGEILASLVSSFLGAPPRLIVLVGPPASGKRFTLASLLGFSVISIPPHISKDEKVSLILSSFVSGTSLVVDGLFPSHLQRQAMILASKILAVPCLCASFVTSLPLCKHLDAFRNKKSHGDVPRVPHAEFSAFVEQFQCPTLVEGFSEIQNIDFTPSFDSQEQKELFELFY